MAPIMNSAIDSLMNNVEKKCATGEEFDIYLMYQGLTMDVIGRTAFGIQTDAQNNPNDTLLRTSVQSEARPSVFKAPSKFDTHVSTHCNKDERLSVNLAQPGNRTRTCGVEARNATTRPLGPVN
ncbi:thromboxane-A synthase [Trichonephila clavipes]|nr:thromboxane-A synthase [Trichonephila clavipes]